MRETTDDFLRGFLEAFGLPTKDHLTSLGLFLLGHAWTDRWLIHLLASHDWFQEIAAGRVVEEAAIDEALDELIAKRANQTFLQHLNLVRDRQLLDSAEMEICEEVNRGRDHFLHWVPGRFSVPLYRGKDVTNSEGLDDCLHDIAHVIRVIQTRIRRFGPARQKESG